MNEFLNKENERMLIGILKKRNIPSIDSDLIFFYNKNENELKNKTLVEMNKMFIDWKIINNISSVSNNLEMMINERKYDTVIKKKDMEDGVVEDPRIKRVNEIKKKMRELMSELDKLLYEL